VPSGGWGNGLELLVGYFVGVVHSMSSLTMASIVLKDPFLSKVLIIVGSKIIPVLETD
jgi:hypothetical protein